MVKDVSFFMFDKKLIKNERYFKALLSLFSYNLKVQFKDDLKKWKKENKINV